MISLRIDSDGNLEPTQQDDSPSVYLDHWAFMDIAGDRQKNEKLVTVLKQKKATLYFFLCIYWNFQQWMIHTMLLIWNHYWNPSVRKYFLLILLCSLLFDFGDLLSMVKY